MDVAPLEALAAEGIEDGAVSLLLAGDELLWRLNREHRSVDAPPVWFSSSASRCCHC